MNLKSNSPQNMIDRSTPIHLSKSLLSGFVRKATHLLGFGNQDNNNKSINEIVYCKNNICVHSKSQTNGNETEHSPGYLNIRYQQDKVSIFIIKLISN